MTATCGACGAENPEGKRFCADCGSPMAPVCPSCGAEVIPGKAFCADCGTALGPAPAAVAAPVPAPAAPTGPTGPVAERRLTSILFGDLVGYTTISESRDPEEVRELLSAYFAMAQKVVGRYGGTIEKFIGDAVMAVWGVPVAHEDDAERAVRAGLDLVDEIRVLASQVRVPELDMRVGVLTGEVAVTIGAVNEGMVAGDSVNTAARIQSAAEPGTVWVDETTRSLTSAAVTYVDAGEHHLKGKSEPLHLYQAGQVVAAVGGAQRVDGLEAPFVARDHELRLVKELFHGALAERRPRLVAVVGVPGVGKSRLAWEFEKYTDGISEEVRWHRSRVLSYGDGVSFYAVAEMVRVRLGVEDGDSAAAVEARIDAWIAEFGVDPAEADWLRPRLGVLLGLGGPAEGTFPRDDLFAAWARFFEHLSEGGTTGVVMVVEDMQHAEPDLLDLFDHLVDTAPYPLFLLTMARPELVDARPGWGTGRRATTVYLEPFDDAAMAQVVSGLVAELPERAHRALVDAAEGIPLYALELVRSLIDRDVVVPSGGRYVLAPDAAERVDASILDAPPSLQALIAARLDALAPDQRAVVQDASVHGLAFSREGIEAVSDVADLDAALAELVRKQILEVNGDRLSSERGQYRFVQAMVRSVAYDTLSRRDRRSRHLRVAAYLEVASDGDELAAINARHYLDAADCAPDEPDTRDLVVRGLAHLERAAQRALAIGSPDEALRHFSAALAREPDPIDRARLLERAAWAAHQTDRLELAVEHARSARTAYEDLGLPLGAGRAVAIAAEALHASYHASDAIALALPVYEQLVGVPDSDEAVLHLASILARTLSAVGDERWARFNDRAAQLAEAHEDWPRVATHLNLLAVNWENTGRVVGATGLLQTALDVARQHHLPREQAFLLANLCVLTKNRDLPAAMAIGREAVEVSLQCGARDLERATVSNLALACWLGGEWDELEELHRNHLEVLAAEPLDLGLVRCVVAEARSARGQPRDDLVIEGFERERIGTLAYVAALCAGAVAGLEGDVAGRSRELAQALDHSYEAMGLEDDFGLILPLAVDAALEAGEHGGAARLLRYASDAARGSVPALVGATLPWLSARLAIAEEGDDAQIDADLDRAVEALRVVGARWFLARALLDRGRRMTASGDPDAAAPLLDEAAAILRQLGAEQLLAAEVSEGAAW